LIESVLLGFKKDSSFFSSGLDSSFLFSGFSINLGVKSNSIELCLVGVSFLIG
jgi:hypothetical protein